MKKGLKKKVKTKGAPPKEGYTTYLGHFATGRKKTLKVP